MLKSIYPLTNFYHLYTQFLSSMLRDIFINPSSIAESESVDFTPRQKALIRCRVLNEIFYLVNNTSSEEHESMLEALDQGQGLSGTIKQSINTFQTRLNMFPVISGGIQSSLGLSSHSLKQELEQYCTTSSNSPIEFDIVSFFVRALIGRIYIPNVSSQNLHVPGVCREYYDLPLADKIVYQYMTICFARFVALDVHSGGFDNAISLSKTSHSSNPVQQHQVAESVAPPTTNAGYQTPLSGTSTPGRQLPSTPGYVQQNRSLGPKTVSFSPQKPNVCIIPPSLPSKRIDFGEFTSTRSMKRPKHHHEINGGAEFVEPRPLPSSRNPVAPYDQAATLQTLTAPLGETGVGMSAFQVASPSSAFKKTPSPHHTNHVYQQSNTTQAQLEDNEVASINQDHGQQLPPPQNHQVEHEAQRKPRPLPSSRNPVASYDQAATLQTPTAPLGETGVGMSAFQVASNKSPSSAFKKTPSPHHANHVYQQSNTTQAQLEDNEVASINQDHGQQLPPPQNHRSPAFSLTSPAYSLTPPMPSPGFYEWLGLTSFE